MAQHNHVDAYHQDALSFPLNISNITFHESNVSAQQLFSDCVGNQDMVNVYLCVERSIAYGGWRIYGILEALFLFN